jgi:hypothetical protein
MAMRITPPAAEVEASTAQHLKRRRRGRACLLTDHALPENKLGGGSSLRRRSRPHAFSSGLRSHRIDRWLAFRPWRAGWAPPDRRKGVWGRFWAARQAPRPYGGPVKPIASIFVLRSVSGLFLSCGSSDSSGSAV